jgi:hypothetical protein
VPCLLKVRIVKPVQIAAARERPLLVNGSVTMRWSPKQTRTQHYKSCWKRCFLYGPCRIYIYEEGQLPLPESLVSS